MQTIVVHYLVYFVIVDAVMVAHDYINGRANGSGSVKE